MIKKTAGSLLVLILVFIAAWMCPEHALATDIMNESVNMKGVTDKTITKNINITSQRVLKFALKAQPDSVKFYVTILNSAGVSVSRFPNSGWINGWVDKYPCNIPGSLTLSGILYSGKVIITLKNLNVWPVRNYVDAPIFLHLYYD